MESRQCPTCGYTWYSADEAGTWICLKCGERIPPERKVVVVVGGGKPRRIHVYDAVAAVMGLPTIEDMTDILKADKSIQRSEKRAERNVKPLNRTREMERRKRQISKGMIKVTGHE